MLKTIGYSIKSLNFAIEFLCKEEILNTIIYILQKTTIMGFLDNIFKFGQKSKSNAQSSEKHSAKPKPGKNISIEQINDLMCQAWNELDINIIAPYLSKDVVYTSTHYSKPVNSKDIYVQYMEQQFAAIGQMPAENKVVAKKVMVAEEKSQDEVDAAEEAATGNAPESKMEEKIYLTTEGGESGSYLDIELNENNKISKIVLRPQFDRFSFEHLEQAVPAMAEIAGDSLNEFFMSTGAVFPDEWSWLQAHVTELRFHDLCILYKKHVFSIMVALYKEIDGEAKILYHDKQYENFLKAAETYNLIPCIFPVDAATGYPIFSDCNLVDAKTFEQININDYKESSEEVPMSDWEVSNLGVSFVVNYLASQGIRQISYCDMVGVCPQIFFNDNNGGKNFVIIRSVPAGLGDTAKLMVPSKTIEKLKEDANGFFVDARWACDKTEDGEYTLKDEVLYRNSNLVHSNPDLVPIDEAMEKFDFIQAY